MASSLAPDRLAEALKQSRYHAKRCFAKFSENGRRMMKFQHLKDEIEQTIEDKVERSKLWEGALGDIFNSTQEAAIGPPYVALAIKHQSGVWVYVKVQADNLSVDKITSTDYLKIKEMVFDENWSNDGNALEVDFGVFGAASPSLVLSNSVENGLSYVSKFLTSMLSGNSDSATPLVDYLLTLYHIGEKLMINETLDTASKLQAASVIVEVYISALPKDVSYQNLEQKLKEWGFEKGWGGSAERVGQTMRILSSWEHVGPIKTKLPS